MSYNKCLRNLDSILKFIKIYQKCWSDLAKFLQRFGKYCQIWQVKNCYPKTDTFKNHRKKTEKLVKFCINLTLHETSLTQWTTFEIQQQYCAILN